ncbi:HpcH/HpaI aldolase family protein [Sphingobium nicotianae]|uniref:Aldolase n=1 Tax=Sphingobium nicotianae TaxID=2782607 RepID=A0A9X1DAD4_9SPHN|nr:aldolase/citrate lyase family protein [Sphingobium nicotianae]MBT2186323.1 aldolase [Sphingobium nicotianae]
MSDASRPNPRDFRKRLLACEPLLGTFLKTPTSHHTEILGSIGFDFVMLDEEHAPWGRRDLQAGFLAGRAFGTAGFVRISRPDAASILQVLDSGAIGIMVPHVSSAKMARNIASWARYRAGDYGKRGADDHYDFTDSLTTVIAVIEDCEALDRIDEIMAVDGIDAFFIGRGDLGLSLSNRLGPKPTVEEVTLNVFQGPSRDRDQGYRTRWMLKQVQHDAFFWECLLTTTFQPSGVDCQRLRADNH